MNRYWSQYVQFSEELYRSRALRFTDVNKDIWQSALHAEDNMNILELGCGGGVFCHRLKTYLPGAKVTGLDFDIGHIEYAKAKTGELGLDCEFVCGDATDLPFPDNTYDLCFSHTVIDFCEPVAFIREQHRILKPGGVIVILNIVGGGINSEMWKPKGNEAEKELFDRLWAEAGKNGLSNIKKYSVKPPEYPVRLEKAGFKDIGQTAFAAVDYNPDNCRVSREAALEQINVNRLTELCSVQKARALAPAALTEEELTRLTDLISEKYDERIGKYLSGEKVWDFEASMVFAVSGRK